MLMPQGLFLFHAAILSHSGQSNNHKMQFA